MKGPGVASGRDVIAAASATGAARGRRSLALQACRRAETADADRAPRFCVRRARAQNSTTVQNDAKGSSDKATLTSIRRAGWSP